MRSRAEVERDIDALDQRIKLNWRYIERGSKAGPAGGKRLVSVRSGLLAERKRLLDELTSIVNKG